MKQILAAGLAGLFLSAPNMAIAASTDWFSMEGGEIRLVTAGGVDESGRIKGALEILLHPGWKTYWLDPGDAGVPPQIDISNSRNVTSAKFMFPPPQRFDDGYAVWAGYKNHVSLAVEFSAGDTPLIDTEIFLGICEKICIPVQIHFTLDPANDESSDFTAVQTAFDALPKIPDDQFKLSALTVVDDESLLANITVPQTSGQTDLFVASTDGWYFGTPVAEPGGKAFRIPLLGQPKEDGEPPLISYTLIHGGESVSGALPISKPQTE